MKRQDIINAIANGAQISNAAAKNALDIVEDSIFVSLRRGEEYQLLGIGKFKVKPRAARTGRNPKTGAPIEIAASKAVSFTTSKVLKDALNT